MENKEKEIEKEQEQCETEAEQAPEENKTEDSKRDDKEKEEKKKKEPTKEEKLEAELKETKDKYLRLMAEYDNFRKRSAKERLEITDTATGNAVKEILSVIDNFERALDTETTDEKYKSGVEMIFKQFMEVLKKLNVEAIDPVGETFDPNIANAVNQIEDPELGENVVAQTFQKGYKIGDKVIRYAMVVVANP
ncbi:MAG: nucleotide exchange factor GrpE [Oscillospiraceae bacterium]